MEYRKENEVERDYQRVKNLVDSTKVSTVREISEILGLSKSQIEKSLAKHPRTQKRIMLKLEERRRIKREERNAEKLRQRADALSMDLQKQKEEEEKELQILDEENDEVVNKQQEEPERSEIKGFVIDTSMADIPSLEQIMKQCLEEGKIIITSVVAKELDKMQQFEDAQGKAARSFLNKAAAEEENFLYEKIDETVGLPDECIIAYCRSQNVALLTADKLMTINARMEGVKTQFFSKKSSNSQKSEPVKVSPAVKVSPVVDEKKLTTLFDATMMAGKLFITCIDTPQKKIKLISEGVQYDSKTHEIKIGDQLFIAKKKKSYDVFCHYEVISLRSEKNSVLKFSRRVYERSEKLEELSKEEYREFMREFFKNK